MTQSGSESDRSDRLPLPPALGCLLSVLLGLMGVAIFFASLSFAFLGEVRFASGELSERRVWLIREQGRLGFGISSASVVSGSQSSGEACVRTRVRFLILRSEEPAAPIEYCECLERVDGSWFTVGQCDE